MRLLVIRHAISEDREAFQETGKEDRLRPLTIKGRKKMRQNVLGLLPLVPKVDLIATSPYTRALQTTEILQEFYRRVPIEKVNELTPSGHLPSLLKWLRKQRSKENVVIVGHEPQLSQFVSKLISGQEGPSLSLKKGAACLVEFVDKLDFSKGKLLWLLQPGILRDFYRVQRKKM